MGGGFFLLSCNPSRKKKYKNFITEKKTKHNGPVRKQPGVQTCVNLMIISASGFFSFCWLTWPSLMNVQVKVHTDI